MFGRSTGSSGFIWRPSAIGRSERDKVGLTCADEVRLSPKRLDGDGSKSYYMSRQNMPHLPSADRDRHVPSPHGLIIVYYVTGKEYRAPWLSDLKIAQKFATNLFEAFELDWVEIIDAQGDVVWIHPQLHKTNATTEG